jgi:hypothetical protein
MGKAPVNTTKEVKDNPLGFLAEGMTRGASEAIENQEAQGQTSFVNSETLPTDMHGNARDVLEKAGVKFGEKVEGDEMFQYVELPAGWKKVSTSHSMWSNLVDEKGRVRAAIFYKAAFYDRSAHLSVNQRYGYSFDYEREQKEHVGVANVTDGGKVIHTTEPVPTGIKSPSIDKGLPVVPNNWFFYSIAYPVATHKTQRNKEIKVCLFF